RASPTPSKPTFVVLPCWRSRRSTASAPITSKTPTDRRSTSSRPRTAAKPPRDGRAPTTRPPSAKKTPPHRHPLQNRPQNRLPRAKNHDPTIRHFACSGPAFSAARLLRVGLRKEKSLWFPFP